MFKFIISAFLIWRINLEIFAFVAKFIIPIRAGFLGPIPWANFDGVHYLSIAENGYAQYEQAFFPFYPLLIRWISPIVGGNLWITGMLISNISFIGVLILLWKITIHLNKKKKNATQIAQHVIIAFLVFPTSYYFGSVYTESLFMLFVLSAYYSLLNKNKFVYGFYAAIASGIRLVGAFLLVPVGMFSYMFYLHRTTGDALMFIHAQPAFGANRSGGELIILPQVIWRYIKIYTSVPLYQYDFWIAVFEMVIFGIALILLWKAWKQKLPRIWIYFSLAAIVGPTFTGTLSSMPRYVLVAFPMFLVLGALPERYRKIYIALSYISLAILTMLFTRGYWVS